MQAIRKPHLKNTLPWQRKVGDPKKELTLTECLVYGVLIYTDTCTYIYQFTQPSDLLSDMDSIINPIIHTQKLRFMLAL